ncbi:MAG: antitoxin [Candidatus Bathyarchaeia archaeon]
MSVTISIRIPKKLKKMLEELDIDWYKETQTYLEKLVRNGLRRKVLNKSDEVRKSIGRVTTPAARLIREDRENEH